MTIRRFAVAVPLLVLAWILVMAGVMRLSDAAPAAVVPFPGQSLIEHLPNDAALLDVNRAALTLANRPGLARDLYAAGAWLVLPAGLTGCLPLSDAQRRALLLR